MTADLDAVDGSAVDETCRAVSQLLRSFPSAPETVTVRRGDVSVELTWGTPEPPASALPSGGPGSPTGSAGTADEPPEGVSVRAPLVGTFYRAPEPGEPPFVSVGDTVAAGQQVGLVESMKLMHPVLATCAGTVLDVPAGDAEPVEYDQPLVTIDPGPDRTNGG